MIHIFFRIGRDQVIVTMRDLIPKKSGTYTSTTRRLFDSGSKFFCCLKNRRIVWLWHIREVVDLNLWHDERMSWLLRKYIEKRIHMLVFVELE